MQLQSPNEFRLNEARSKKINQKEYLFYVFNIETSKIAEGFEYQDDAKDRIKELLDESDNILKGKLKVYTMRALISKKIDPNEDSNWADPKWLN